jgi:fumarylacetoacetase
LKYLQEKNHISYDINLNVAIKTPKSESAHTLCQTNFKHMYWSVAQQLTHHAVTGCNMQPGDMLGSGTISGSKKEEYGSLLELTWGGRDEIPLPNGEVRKFVADGDSIIMTGWANRNGKRIGFGDCEGTVLPALEESHYF